MMVKSKKTGKTLVHTKDQTPFLFLSGNLQEHLETSPCPAFSLEISKSLSPSPCCDRTPILYDVWLLSFAVQDRISSADRDKVGNVRLTGDSCDLWLKFRFCKFSDILRIYWSVLQLTSPTLSLIVVVWEFQNLCCPYWVSWYDNKQLSDWLRQKLSQQWLTGSLFLPAYPVQFGDRSDLTGEPLHRLEMVPVRPETDR
jgi:hypothetical protein